MRVGTLVKNYADIVDWIRTVRAARQLTQTGLAELCDLSLATVYRVESAENVRIDTLLKIILVLGGTIELIQGETDA